MKKLVTLPLWVLFFCLAGFWTTQGRTEMLIVSFGSHNTSPYTFVEDGKLIGGIYKDIMDEVGKALHLNVVYKQTQKKRQEKYLLQGKRHVLVLSNPLWQKHRDQYSWSVPLTEETNIFVVSARNSFAIRSFEDLHGKHLGTILGYRYPELTDKFGRKEIFREDVISLEQNFNKLKIGRIDCLIGSDILIGYYLKAHNAHNTFLISEKSTGSHPLMTALSSHAPISVEQLNTLYKQLKDNGKLTDIFAKYK